LIDRSASRHRNVISLYEESKVREQVISLKKWFVSLAVFIGTGAVTAVVGLFLGLLLVGPHSDLLPEAFRVPAGLLIWAGILGIPAWLSCKVFSKYATREKRHNI
jgi:hypothetical protein